MRASVEDYAGIIVGCVFAFFIGHLIWALLRPKQFWKYSSIYGVPVLMIGAWVFLAFTAETDSTGYAWMAVGFAFVAVLWFMFRIAISRASMLRAVNTGDAARTLQIANARFKDAALYRVLAHEMRGDWTKVLAESGFPADPGSQLLAACARVGAFVELGRLDEARAELDAAPRPEVIRKPLPSPAPILKCLAEGRIQWAAGDLEAASQLLRKTADDIRTGPYTRAEALTYLARIADAQNKPALASRERAEAATLSPLSWVSGAAELRRAS